MIHFQITDDGRCEENVNTAPLTWEGDIAWVVVIGELCM